MWTSLSREELEQVRNALDGSGHSALADRLANSLIAGEHDAAFHAAAREKYSWRLSDGDLDFDDQPGVSQGDKGAYVLGWLWVTNSEAGMEDDIDEEDGEEDSDG
jgi:hypothetical protein